MSWHFKRLLFVAIICNLIYNEFGVTFQL
uniref:Uncharacterized protein n=1 Tax=Arundo donax TaxID=35708 RepID=A0A0A9DWM3_ARUDO